MIEKIIKKNPVCMQHALTIVGDKWTPVILSRLMQKPHTFSELELAIIPITPRVLSDRLKKLQSQAIVSKKIYCKHPPRYVYTITKKGSELHEVIENMAKWGDKYSR